MTKEQLLKFIKIRNASGFQSNLQFEFDAREAGFDAKDLGHVAKVDNGLYEWKTPHGVLVEFHGVLELMLRD